MGSHFRVGRRKRSSIWEYYNEEEGNPGGRRRRSAICKICYAVISAVDGSTSGLIRHLSFRHNHKVEGGVGTGHHNHLGDLEGILERLRKEWEEKESGQNQKRKEKKGPDPGPASSGTTSTSSPGEGFRDPSESGEPDVPKHVPNQKRKLIRRKKNSPFWEFFTPLVSGVEARCRICDAIIKTTGGTTSGLSRHLLSIHKADAGNLGQLRREFLRLKSKNSVVDDSYDDDNEDQDEDDENIGGGDDDEEGPKPKVLRIRIDETRRGSCDDVEDEDDGGGGEDVEDIDMEEDAHDPLWEEEDEESEEEVTGTGKGELAKPTCFICHTSFDRNSAPHSSQEEYRFLFMEILELPIRKSLDYLEKLEGHEDWIHLCPSCQTLVVDGVSTRKQIIRLQFQLEQCQKKMLTKVKSESRSNKVTGKKFQEYPKQQRQVVEGIREFVDSRIYSVLQCDDNLEPPGSSITQSQKGSQALYCGLCDDDKCYRSEALLATHTKKVHQPSSSTSTSSSRKLVKLGRGKKKSILTTSTKSAPKKRDGYDCPNCPKVRDYPVAKYVRHLSIHQRKPYQCIACFEFLPPDESLREQHWEERHPDIQHPPDTNKFVRIKFHPGRIWKCESCMDGFYSEEDRDQHELRCVPLDIQEQNGSLQLSERKPHQCSSCPLELRFRNISEWRLHRILHHPEVDAMSCPFCDLSFCETTVEGVEARHDKKMVDHMAAVHKSVRLYDDCEFCGLVFETGFDKKEHVMEKHAIPGNQVFSCGVCNLSVSSVQGLRKHMSLVHFEMDVSICNTCGKKFLGREALLHHDFIYHGNIPEGAEVLHCPEEGCSYKGVIRRRLDHHVIMAHEYERSRPFMCRYCGKGFKQTGALKNHEEIHRNRETRPYQCDLCGSSFTLLLYLKSHKRGAHGVGGDGIGYRKRLHKAQGWRSRSRKNSVAPSEAAAATISSAAAIEESFPSTDMLSAFT